MLRPQSGYPSRAVFEDKQAAMQFYKLVSEIQSPVYRDAHSRPCLPDSHVSPRWISRDSVLRARARSRRRAGAPPLGLQSVS